MKIYIFTFLIICLSGRDEIEESRNAKIFSIFVQNVPRHSIKEVDGGDYVSLEIDSYSKYSTIPIYCAFNTTEDIEQFKYQYRSYKTNDWSDFVTSLFWNGYSTNYTKKGTEYNFTMYWTRTSSLKYLLFIPQKIGGSNKITIQNDYPSNVSTIIGLIVIGVIVVGFVIFVAFIFIKKKFCS